MPRKSPRRKTAKSKRKGAIEDDPLSAAASPALTSSPGGEDDEKELDAPTGRRSPRRRRSPATKNAASTKKGMGSSGDDTGAKQGRGGGSREAVGSSSEASPPGVRKRRSTRKNAAAASASDHAKSEGTNGPLGRKRKRPTSAEEGQSADPLKKKEKKVGVPKDPVAAGRDSDHDGDGDVTLVETDREKREGKGRALSDRWLERFRDLESFQRKHGHCRVRRSSSESVPLGRWVAAQRRDYRDRFEGKTSAMTDERIEMLEGIGFEWCLRSRRTNKDEVVAAVTAKEREKEQAESDDKKRREREQQDNKWRKNFDDLRMHVEEKGDFSQTTGFLSRWMYWQRRSYRVLLEGRKTYMTPQKIRLLDSIGFDWDEVGPARYLDNNNHDKNEAVSDEGDDERPPPAVTKTTTPASGDKETARPYRYRPKKQERKWNSHLEELRRYRAENGHCRVPQNHPTNLGVWMVLQRRAYRKLKDGKPSPMTEERIRLLEGVDGFHWEPPRGRCNRTDRQWSERFEEVKAFREEHGHFRAPDKSALAAWMTRQRMYYRRRTEGGPGEPLPDDRVELLNSISFNWEAKDPARTDKWNRKLEELKRYKAEHGHTNVPFQRRKRERVAAQEAPAVSAADGQEESKGETDNDAGDKKTPNVMINPLGTWVAKQRADYARWKKGQKSPMNGDKVIALEAIGFRWALRDSEAAPPLQQALDNKKTLSSKLKSPIMADDKTESLEAAGGIDGGCKGERSGLVEFDARATSDHSSQREFTGTYCAEIMENEAEPANASQSLEEIGGIEEVNVKVQQLDPDTSDQFGLSGTDGISICSDSGEAIDEKDAKKLQATREKTRHDFLDQGPDTTEVAGETERGEEIECDKLAAGLPTAGDSSETPCDVLTKIAVESSDEAEERGTTETPSEQQQGCTADARDEISTPVKRKRKRKAEEQAPRGAPEKPSPNTLDKKRAKRREERWLRRFEELRKHRDEHGHCRGVTRKLYPGGLGNWAEHQRRAYRDRADGKDSTMTDERMQKLCTIGFDWVLCKRGDDQWLVFFEELRSYKAQHGHCNVTRTENKFLGEWAGRQRSLYRNYRSSLSEEKRRLLESIGFEFNIKEVRVDKFQSGWDTQLRALVAYRSEHGGSYPPKGEPLGNWVSNQRKARWNRQNGKKTSMTDERIRLLDEIGFDWGTKKPGAGKTWEERFEDIVRWRNEHGHCNVPTKQGDSLSRWVSNQRQNYRRTLEGGKRLISDERIALLNGIGFEWTIKKQKKSELAPEPHGV